MEAAIAAPESQPLLSRSGGVVTVTLDGTDAFNALAPSHWEALLTSLREVAASGGDRCVVLTGAGANFSSGGDTSSRPEQHMLAVMRTAKQVAVALHELPQPTIAKVRGVAAGAGMNLALGCDLIAAADDARFSELFVKRGLSLDTGGSWLLPRLVGLRRAKELSFFGGWVSAQEAAAMGLVNWVVPGEQLDSFVTEKAMELASGPPIALTQTKSMLNNATMLTFAQALEEEGRAQALNFSTNDVREAYRAYREKRSAVYSGR